MRPEVSVHLFFFPRFEICLERLHTREFHNRVLDDVASFVSFVGQL